MDIEKLKKLKEAYESGLLSKDEYDAKRLAMIDCQILSKSPPTQHRPAESARERPSSPRAVSPGQSRKAATGASSPSETLAQSPEGGTSPRSRPKFDVSQPYDPANQKRGYKEDHQRQAVPMPPKGTVGQRVVLPASLHQFTGLKVVQEPENAKVGVYLGPKGGSGGVYASQYDVRKKLAIGAPEVSTTAHVGSAASKVGTVLLRTAGAVAFEERVFASTNVLDLIAACVRRLELVHPPSYFGLIQKRDKGEVWISPDVLASELGTDAHLVVVPKQAAPEDIKRAYMARVLRQPAPYTVETDGPAVDVETAPNEGKQFYKQYDL